MREVEIRRRQSLQDLPQLGIENQNATATVTIFRTWSTPPGPKQTAKWRRFHTCEKEPQHPSTPSPRQGENLSQNTQHPTPTERGNKGTAGRPRGGSRVPAAKLVAHMTRSCTATRSTTMRAKTVSPRWLCATNSVTMAVEDSVAAAERKTLSTFFSPTSMQWNARSHTGGDGRVKATRSLERKHTGKTRRSKCRTDARTQGKAGRSTAEVKRRQARDRMGRDGGLDTHKAPVLPHKAVRLA